MLRFLSIIVAAQVTMLSVHGTASAASDITLAAISTGRLYVVGTTERPHTPIVLDDQFRTVSDDKGTFQYELVYHPARCIVSATIEGKAYEAVVSNCGQQCSPGPTQGSGAVAAVRPQPGPGRPAGLAAPAGASGPQGSQSIEVTPPAGQRQKNQMLSNSSVFVEGASRLKDETRSMGRIANPPLPPQRPVLRANAQARSSQAAKTTGNTAPVRRGDPRGVERWLSN